MSTTPAGPTLSGQTDHAGDPIVRTGSGLLLTNDHLIVLQATTTDKRRCDRTCGMFPNQVAELQRDGLLSTDDTPVLSDYGYDALVLAGWL
jgi:hypothetical protein